MSLKHQRAREWIRKRQTKPKREYPLVTMTYYGPDDQRATRLVVEIIENDGEEPEVLNRWTSDEGDIRHDDQVLLDRSVAKSTRCATSAGRGPHS